MSSRPPHASELLADYGQRLFGPEWAAPMARLTRAQERTLRRIRMAAREGREYPAARGVLAAFHDALSALAEEVKDFGR